MYDLLSSVEQKIFSRICLERTLTSIVWPKIKLQLKLWEQREGGVDGRISIFG